MVQKYLKGYLTHKRTLKAMCQNKIEIADKFFYQMRVDYFATAQIKIAYEMRKYIKFMRATEKFEAEVKANKLLKK